MSTASDDGSQVLHPEPGWSAREGHSVLQRVAPEAAGGNAIDHLLIAERIARYGCCFDERNPELLGDCFTSDGVWEGRIMGEISIGPFEGRAAIVRWLAAFWPQQFDQRRHVFTNVTIDDLTATTATAHSYLLLTRSADATLTPVTVGPYRLRMAKDARGLADRPSDRRIRRAVLSVVSRPRASCASAEAAARWPTVSAEVPARWTRPEIAG